jgi:hypothetical protein
MARHVEGICIAPAHRAKGVVGKHLLRQMRDMVQADGGTSVITHAQTDDVREMIQKLQGVRLPGDPYLLPMGGRF